MDNPSKEDPPVPVGHYYFETLNERSFMTGILEYLIRLAGDADPLQKGFQAQTGYIFFNIVIPILLGGLLSRITGPIEWFVGRLIGKTG